MQLKKICIFGFLEEAWERLASPKPPLKEKKVLTSCQKMWSTIIYTQNGKLIDQSKYVYSHTRKEEFYKDIHRWYKVKNDSIFGIYDLYGNSIVPEKYIDIQTVYVNKKYHFIITDKKRSQRCLFTKR